MIKFLKRKLKDYAFEVSNVVFEARLKKGITQTELARRMGTKQPSIARIERGSVVPSLSFLFLMAEALGTTLMPPQFKSLLEESTQQDVRTTAVVTASLGFQNNDTWLDVQAPRAYLAYNNLNSHTYAPTQDIMGNYKLAS